MWARYQEGWEEREAEKLKSKGGIKDDKELINRLSLFNLLIHILYSVFLCLADTEKAYAYTHDPP